MTGTGTQADPYIVETWAEFLSVCNVSTATYVEWNNAEVDFNDIQPTGFTEPIEITSNISLYKVKWKNFVSLAKIAFKIKASSTKLNFEEFEFTDVELFHPTSNNSYDGALFSSGRNSYYGVYTLSKCVFTYRQDSAASGGFIKFMDSNSKISGTAINIKSTCQGEFKFYGLNLYECNVNLDITAASVSGNINAFLSWFSGKITTSAASWTSTTANLLGNFVFDVECNAAITLNTYQFVCVYNSDKCSVSGTNWVGATTAQLSDTTYLYNQGLPVAGVSV